MENKFSRLLLMLLVGIVLIVIGMTLHATNLTALSYILESIGIVLALIFCALAGNYMGKDKKEI